VVGAQRHKMCKNAEKSLITKGFIPIWERFAPCERALVMLVIARTGAWIPSSRELVLVCLYWSLVYSHEEDRKSLNGVTIEGEISCM